MYVFTGRGLAHDVHTVHSHKISLQCSTVHQDRFICKDMTSFTDDLFSLVSQKAPVWGSSRP